MKPRRGLSTIELIVIITAVGILSAIGLANYSDSVEDTRVATCKGTVEDYLDVFTTVCGERPGLVRLKKDTWTTVDAYSAEQAFFKLVVSMNQLLDEEAQFYWDDSIKCWRSVGDDPWGGFYILTDHPESDTEKYVEYSASNYPENFLPLSIWATGNNDAVLETQTVTNECYGGAFVFRGGVVSSTLNGFDNSAPFEGFTLTFK